MVKKKADKKKVDLKNCCNMGDNKSCGGCAYFLGFLGALVYYISTATSFGAGVFGVIKALVWPAFLVFKLLGL